MLSHFLFLFLLLLLPFRLQVLSERCYPLSHLQVSAPTLFCRFAIFRGSSDRAVDKAKFYVAVDNTARDSYAT